MATRPFTIDTNTDPALLTAQQRSGSQTIGNTSVIIANNTHTIDAGENVVVVTTDQEVFVTVNEENFDQNFITNQVNNVGGGDGQVQYNANGSFAGDNTFTFSNITKVLTVGGLKTDTLLYSNGQPWNTGGSNAEPGGSNGQLQFNDAGAFNGVPGVTWANAQLNLGVLSNLSISGGSSGQVLTTNGSGGLSWTTPTAPYGNANVAAYLPTYTGNVGANWIKADYVMGNANPLYYIPGANVVGAVPSATVAGSATVASSANSVALANVAGAGNIASINLSGSSSNVLYGNGTWAPVSGGNSANANYANFAGTAYSVAGANVSGEVANADFSNRIAVEAVNNNYSYHVVLTTGPGDSTLHNDVDDNFQYNPADGILTVTRTDMDYLSVSQSVISNLVPFDSLPLNLGNVTNPWQNIHAGNATLTGTGTALNVSSGNILTNQVTGTAFNFLNGLYTASLTGQGATSNYTLNLPATAGSNGQVLSTDGTGNLSWTSAGGGGGLPLANGNSNINIATANGPVTLTSAGQTWTVGTDGTLTAPNNSNIYPAGNNFNVFTPPAGSVQFYSDGGNYSWSLDGFGVMNLPFASAMSNTALIYSPGNLRLDAGANNFMFTDAGTVVFPTLTVDLHNGGNQYAQTLQFGDDTQQAVITGPTPAANVNAQRLIIQGQRGNGTGEGGDVYFWAGDADTNGGDIKIYAGDADNVSAGYGGYINLEGGRGYDGGGQISVNGGYSANGPGGTVNISAGQGGSDGGAVNINGGVTSTNQGGNITLTGGYGGNSGGEVRLTGGSAGIGLPGYGNIVLISSASTWTFDNTGTLTVPQNIHGNGALQLQGLANGNTTINIGSGVGGDIDMVSNLGNINLYTANNQPWIFDQGGNLTAPGAINVGNMVIGTVPGDITADANTGVTFNVSGPDGGFAVNYLDEVGNANTSGGELAFSSETGNATYRISLSDDLGDGFATKIWRFDGTGNLTLPGNTFAVNYANGTQVPLGGGNTGNVTFNDINIIGTGNLHLQPDPANSSSYLDIFLTSGPDLHLVASAAANLILGKDAGPNVMTSWDGNVYVQSWNTGSNTQGGVWNFGEDGNLILAGGNSVIQSIANSSLDPTNPNVSTMTLTPDANYNSQVLVLDPTAPGHIHLRAYAFSNIDEPAANIFLGGEDTAFEITSGANNEARIHSGGNTWTFNNDGNLQVAGDVFANTGASPAPSLYGFSSLQVYDQINIGGVTITSADGSNGQVLTTYGNGVTYWSTVSGGGNGSPAGSNNQIQFNSNGAFGASGNYTFADTVGGGTVTVGNELVLLGNGTIGTANSNLNIQPAGNLIVTASAYNWKFDTAGNLTLPGNTFSVNYANGSQASAPLVDVLNTNGLTTVYYPTFVENRTTGQTVRADVDLSYRTDTNTLTVGNITVNSQSTLIGNSTTGANAVIAGITNTILPNSVAAFSANVNNYTQVTLQNKSTGADATADFVATADNGSDTVNYMDLGIINSGYDNNTPTNSLGNIVFAADSYLYAQGNVSNTSQAGGNLAIGTTVAGKTVKIFAGGTNSSSIVANIANTGITVTGNLSVSGNITGNTAGFAIGYRDIPQVAASNATIGLSDAGKHFYSTTAGNLTLTIPLNSTTAFPTGTAINIVVQAAGNVLVNAASGVTLYLAGNSTAANRVVGTYGMATLLKVATDTWFINGTGVS